MLERVQIITLGIPFRLETMGFWRRMASIGNLLRPAELRTARKGCVRYRIFLHWHYVEKCNKNMFKKLKIKH